MDDAAGRWGFRPCDAGDHYPAAEYVFRAYRLDYAPDAEHKTLSHLYVTASRPAPPKDHFLRINLSELFSWSESPLMVKVRQDLLDRLVQRFGPQAVRQE